jgi:hypothetical protein
MTSASSADLLLAPVLVSTGLYILSLTFVRLRSPISNAQRTQLRHISQYHLIPLVYWSVWLALTAWSVVALITALSIGSGVASFVAVAGLLISIVQHLDSALLWLHEGSLSVGHVAERSLSPLRLWIDLQLLTSSQLIPFISLSHFMLSFVRNALLLRQSIRQTQHRLFNSQQSSQSIAAVHVSLSQSQLIVHALLFLHALYRLQTTSSAIWLHQLLVLTGLIMFMSAWADFQRKFDQSQTTETESIDCNNNHVDSFKSSANRYVAKTPVGVYSAPQPVCSTINRRFG